MKVLLLNANWILFVILVGRIKPGEIEIRCLLFGEWSPTEKFGLENVCVVVCV